MYMVFFLRSAISSPATVDCSVSGGTWRRPGPRRRGRFLFDVGIKDGSITSPGRTIGASVAAMTGVCDVAVYTLKTVDISMFRLQPCQRSLGGLALVVERWAESGGRAGVRTLVCTL